LCAYGTRDLFSIDDAINPPNPHDGRLAVQLRYGYGEVVTNSRTVTVPVVVGLDENGNWCAHAQLRPGLGAHGEGTTEDEAIQDLREALTGLIEEFGVPRELSVTVAA
jgi:predicted RNase H-like HicB family nuclease